MKRHTQDLKRTLEMLLNLVSLWPVSDASTAGLMVDFYDELLAGTPEAEALRRAKPRLLRRHLEYAKPYHWSTFVLIGG